MCPPIVINSGKKRYDFIEPRPGPRLQKFHGRQEVFVRHAGAEKRPSRGLLLDRKEAVRFFGSEDPAGCAFQAFEIELHLLHQSGIEHPADFEIAVDGIRPFLRGARVADRSNHQRIELRVLRFFHPVVLEQALELRIQLLVVGHAVEVVPLSHPLDVQNHQRNRQRMLRENRLRNGFRRTDDFAVAAEGTEEVLAKPLEQVDVLGFFAGEIQKRPDAGIVSVQHWPGMIEYEGQDELLDKAEYVEVVVPTNVIESETLLWRQEVERLDPGQRLRQKRLAEVQAFVASDQIFDPPVHFFRCCERIFKRVVGPGVAVSLGFALIAFMLVPPSCSASRVSSDGECDPLAEIRIWYERLKNH